MGADLALVDIWLAQTRFDYTWRSERAEIFRRAREYRMDGRDRRDGKRWRGEREIVVEGRRMGLERDVRPWVHQLLAEVGLVLEACARRLRRRRGRLEKLGGGGVRGGVAVIRVRVPGLSGAWIKVGSPTLQTRLGPRNDLK